MFKGWYIVMLLQSYYDALALIRQVSVIRITFKDVSFQMNLLICVEGALRISIHVLYFVGPRTPSYGSK